MREESSFVGRWTKRLFVLALLGGAGLVAGFKAQKQQWAWQDPAGFQAYCGEVWNAAKTKTVAVAAAAKKKADDAGITAQTEQLIDKAKKLLAMEDEKPAPAAPAEMAPSGETASMPAESAPSQGKADPAAVAAASKVPPGYYDAYKTGYDAYREGLKHFQKSMPRQPGEQAELKAAKAKFEVARDSWAKAAQIYDGDPRLASLQSDLNLYLVDCNKRIKPTY